MSSQIWTLLWQRVTKSSQHLPETSALALSFKSSCHPEVILDSRVRSQEGLGQPSQHLTLLPLVLPFSFIPTGWKQWGGSHSVHLSTTVPSRVPGPCMLIGGCQPAQARSFPLASSPVMPPGTFKSHNLRPQDPEFQNSENLEGRCQHQMTSTEWLSYLAPQTF